MKFFNLRLVVVLGLLVVLGCNTESPTTTDTGSATSGDEDIYGGSPPTSDSIRDAGDGSGASGVSGTIGTSGTSGVSGTTGVSGVSGTAGASGTTGTSGATGSSGGSVVPGGGIIADHTAVAAFDRGIPGTAITNAKSNLHIFYGHTSHGSQLLTGMAMLGSPYYTAASHLDITEEPWADLGHCGDGMGWSSITTDHLSSGPGSDTNVVIWSWCGGVADNTTTCIANEYLAEMNRLERLYPGVRFVYMTGRHWNQDGSALAGGEGAGTRTSTNALIEANNNIIRNYCRTNNKVLFDFADIEAHDPNGVPHLSTSDACTDPSGANWCNSWCSAHGNPGYCTTCNAGAASPDHAWDCAHSHCLICSMKGKAFMWLMARLAGWGG